VARTVIGVSVALVWSFSCEAPALASEAGHSEHTGEPTTDCGIHTLIVVVRAVQREMEFPFNDGF
jgi:hypothetical protein